MNLIERTKNDPNRHSGVSSKSCHCGLVHDDELSTRKGAREQVIDLLGGKCANPECRWLNVDGTLGCNDRKLLQIDHVNDDGFLDRKTKRQVVSYWFRVLRSVIAREDRYQLLCANCNWAKREKAKGWAVIFSSWQRFL